MRIGNRQVGGDAPCYIVAEIGINHNGDIDTALRMIDAAEAAGVDAVKFQKRTIDLVYTPEELAQPRESPFGHTNGDLKRGLEFSERQYGVIAHYARRRGIAWFASAWDLDSVSFLNRFEVPAHKVASAKLTDDALIRKMAKHGRPVIVSTGMSTLQEVHHVWCLLTDCGIFCVVLLVCTASYPAAITDLHLERIRTLYDAYESDYTTIGYSGHEVGVWTTLCAVAMGAKIVERHLTLDRSMWGSDQAASLEPTAFAKLVREIRDFERARGSGELRCLPCEEPQKAKLRK